ncbi:Serine/threonine protein kinase [Armadillidium vulgare iridescent virus]|uniref:Serine/threonine protein kinase n=1 Tax=Armadillidium vulgare iridescent virus TaxID=72201 RepID=A0A068QKK2_9VIRU|nr:Serine/threonine protein kinase [Armadillidium vulgare iridescent virus]CCV02501.1 Serine/threonine protein kinase [Armadillidium vulgare iridescent virus]
MSLIIIVFNVVSSQYTYERNVPSFNKMNFDKKKCDEWKQRGRLVTSPVNPFTNRKIKKDGPTYKKVELICNPKTPAGNAGNAGKIVDLDKVCKKWLSDKYPGVKLPKVPKVVPKRNPLITEDEDDDDIILVPGPAPNPSPIVPIKGFEDSLANRKIISREITDFLRKTINDKTLNGNACMSNTKTLLQYFKNVKMVGKGSFGTVYVADLKIAATTLKTVKGSSFQIAIKEGQITAREAREARQLRFPVEYLYNRLMNNILDDGYSPSFNYTYCILFCDQCEVIKWRGNKQVPSLTTCSVTMVEKADSDLKGLTNQCSQLSALFQILAAVHCIHILYGMHHRDIKIENVLIRKIPYKPNQYWRFKVDGFSYFVPNMGFIALLNDFGVSDALSPAISDNDYGVRNAEVVGTSNGFKFVPFTTKRYPQLEKNGSITPIAPYHLRGSKTLTLNKFWKNFNSQPSIAVDLADFQRFPAFAMYQDIQDTLRMFIGGPQTVQPGSHDVMKGLVPAVKQELSKYYERLAPTSMWPEHRVELFLANKLIHKIFRHFQYHTLPPGGVVLETYTLPTD